MTGGNANGATVVVGDNQPIRRQAVVELVRHVRGVGGVVSCGTADEVASASRDAGPAAGALGAAPPGGPAPPGRGGGAAPPPLCSCPETLRQLAGRLEPANVVVYPV